MELFKKYKGRDFFIYKVLDRMFPDLSNQDKTKMLEILESGNNMIETIEGLEMPTSPSTYTIIYTSENKQIDVTDKFGNITSKKFEDGNYWLHYDISMFIRLTLEDYEVLVNILYNIFLYDDSYKNNKIQFILYKQQKEKNMSNCTCCTGNKRVTRAIRERVEYLRKRNHHSFATIADKVGISEDKVRKIWNRVK